MVTRDDGAVGCVREGGDEVTYSFSGGILAVLVLVALLAKNRWRQQSVVLFLLVLALLSLTIVPLRAVAQGTAPDAPTAVAVYSISSEKLEVRWSSSDTSTTLFKIQWKSGSEEFDSSRQLSSDPATSIQNEQTTSSGKRYKDTLTGLTDGREYTIQVIAANSNGDSEPSGEATGTPQSSPGQAREFYENEVVKIFESSFPWLRETWDYVTTQSVSVSLDAKSVDWGVHGWVCVENGATRPNLRECRVSSIKLSSFDPDLIYAITHELAHVYTLANGVTSTPAPLGIAHLYFSDLISYRNTLALQGCGPVELYADALTVLTLGDDWPGRRGYWVQCSRTPDSVSDEALAIVRNASTGVVPAWFEETYNDTVGDPDLERVWADAKAIWAYQAAAVFQLRDAFGGYCDDYRATLSVFSDGVTRNPWRDGGCFPDAPTDVSVAAVGNGKLTVSWQEPPDDGGSPIKAYYVQWKSGAEEYDFLRRAWVRDLTDLRWTIDGLTNDISHSIRVFAYNINSGNGEAAEVTATPTAVDSTPPSLLSARVERTVLRLNWREALDETSTPETSAFTVNVGASTRAIDEISISGSVVTLMLESAVSASDAVTVDYSEPSGSTATPLKDSAGNSVASFSTEMVRNDTTQVAITSDAGPDMTYHWGNGLGTEDTIVVTVTFSERVLVSGVPELELLIGRRTRRADFSSGSGTTSLVFRYTMTEAETEATVVRVPSGAVQTSSGLVRYSSSKLVAPANVALVSISRRPNTPPEFPSSEDGTRSVEENTPAMRNIGTPILATDSERNGLTYSISGSDTAFFDVVASSGQLRTKAALDHESKSSYSFTMSVHDGKDIHGDTDTTIDDTISVTVTVNDVDEPADISFVTAGGVTANNTTFAVDENYDGTLASFTASDPENKSGLTYTWSFGGSDRGDFAITAAGVLSFANVPDYERPADSGGNNGYDVTVSVLDSDGKTGNIDMTVTVRPVNEPPTITGNATPNVVEEGTRLVWTYGATDQDDTTIAWLPLDGDDSDKFEFNSSNGKLEFKAVPDYESAGDTGGNNLYEVTLSASAGGQTTPFDIAVSVTNKEEFDSLTFSSPQPQADADYTATLSDPDGVVSTTWTWERSTSRNGPWTSVSGASDSTETSVYQPDADDVGYYLRVTASFTDGHGPDKSLLERSAKTVIAVPVDNTAPSFATPTTTREIAEDALSEAVVGAPVTATDPGDVLTYTLSGSSRFTIDSARGRIRVASGAMLDHERGPSHTVSVTVSDSSNATASISVTISVTNVNEAPEADDIIESTNEDTPVILNVLADSSDPENDVLTVSLGRGPRNGSAVVDPDTYEITYTPKSDYHGADTVTYILTDPGRLTDSGEIALTIHAVNDAPLFSRGPLKRQVARSAQAGDDVGSPVTATDIDGDSPTYRLTGPNASSFEIDETGQITVGPGIVFDPGIQSEYTVTVEARDRDFGAEVEVTITVVERVQPPTTGGGGGGGGGPPPVPIPSDADFDWNVTRDIESLHRENDLPTDIWSNGKTLWVLENSASGADRVFAYDLQTGERRQDAEFELESRNRFSHGLWSDDETVWVADSGQDKLFAYKLASGERLAERDIELAERNRDPRGIWSDGETLYVLDSVKDALFVYDFETGELVAEYPLDKLNKSPRGIWSDGVTIWVSDDGAKRLFAYEFEDTAMTRNEDLEFTFRSLLKAGNGDARGLWSDGDIMYVVDEQDDTVYSYNIPDATIAQLASLSLSDIDIEEFSPNRFEYTATAVQEVSLTTVTVEASQEAATVAIEPVDADGDLENGNQVNLGAETTITIRVRSEDGSRTTTYQVQVSKPLCLGGLSDERLSEVTFVGGSVSDLEACARSLDVSAFYHHRDGVWRALFVVPDLPEFLSQPFRNRFLQGLVPGEPLIAHRQMAVPVPRGRPNSN